ncbi:hypothetical protein [Methylobacterium sp. SI9]|uniref:hypothetical protein n=1 Tax=Methylobacterium guangdongense TaxID=3138811 RepID=UPI00313CB2ED
MSRLETVNVGLEPDILALIDLLRRSSPDLPSRSSIIRQLVNVAVAVFTDEASVEALAEHHAAWAEMLAEQTQSESNGPTVEWPGRPFKFNEPT